VSGGTKYRVVLKRRKHRLEAWIGKCSVLSSTLSITKKRKEKEEAYSSE
jgi:hypothetical protein